MFRYLRRTRRTRRIPCPSPMMIPSLNVEAYRTDGNGRPPVEPLAGAVDTSASPRHRLQGWPVSAAEDTDASAASVSQQLTRHLKRWRAEWLTESLTESASDRTQAYEVPEPLPKATTPSAYEGGPTPSINGGGSAPSSVSRSPVSDGPAQKEETHVSTSSGPKTPSEGH